MISVDEALGLVLEQKRSFGIEEVNFLHSVGRVIAVDVFADRDFPPFDRVSMDGIALKVDSFNAGRKKFRIAGVQAAGTKASILDNHDECIEVMTGAVLPLNTNAVVPYEQCSISNGYAVINTDIVNDYQNIHLKGSDITCGEILGKRYETITTRSVGILSTVGISEVPVLALPRIAVCSTGDELVDITQDPEPHQIRRSNSYTIASALLKENIDVSLDHLNDDAAVMIKQLASLIEEQDVIILSGAVSKGKFDFLPKVLQDLGMTTIFHLIAQRPGKPFLFGSFANGPLVFAFPGNPVSTFVCYHKYFLPWLRASINKVDKTKTAVLTQAVEFKPNLALHQLVQLKSVSGVLQAIPVKSGGSGDMVTLLKADGIITLPAGKVHFAAGDVFEVIEF